MIGAARKRASCKSPGPASRNRATERWPSGRRRTPGKCVGGKPSRGFESLSLRHYPHCEPMTPDLPRDFFHLEFESDPTKGRTMLRTRYSEEQIIGILTEHEVGAKCADLCCQSAFKTDPACGGGCERR